MWLDALRPGGRLLFPLTPAEGGTGAALLMTRRSEQQFGVSSVSPAAFISCIGARDEETAIRLTEAFRRGGAEDVKSLRRDTEPDDSCWFAGGGWWLSTAE